ncbi:MAG TPA: helix-turn-helix domain-containing protein [Burkholderiales bacterium]|jgi:DNA-binding CsgD family transcriptional regulator|nr:helix-turn-helix domain-containing protein [Burkholderiales bacterium]
MAFAYEHTPRGGSSSLESYWNDPARKAAISRVIGYHAGADSGNEAQKSGTVLVQAQKNDGNEGYLFLRSLCSASSCTDLGRLLNIALGLAGFQEFRLVFIAAPAAGHHGAGSQCTVISSVPQYEYRAQNPQTALRRIPGYEKPTGIPQLWCNLRELDIEPEVARAVFPLPGRVVGITFVSQGRGLERLYLCAAANPGTVAPLGYLVPRIASIAMLASMCHAGMRALAERAGRSMALEDLTKREFQCLYWAAAGKTALETSSILSIAMRTANFHLQNAIEKLGAANKYEAIVIATRLGLMDDELEDPRGLEE